MRRRRLVIAIPLLALVAGGAIFAATRDSTDELRSADGDATTTASASASASPSPSPSTPACLNEDVIFEGPRTGPVVRGAIDPDDDLEDGTWIVLDESGDSGCRAFLVVAFGEDFAALGIDREGETLGDGLPQVTATVPIDERPGAEIVVTMARGASTEFVGVFSMGSGELEMIEIEGEDEFNDLFPTGGSAGHLEAVDCSRDGEAVASLVVPQGDGYEITRNFYASDDGIFVPDRVETETLDDLQDLESYQEFLATPFKTCGEESEA